jgi:hypothetical protein
LTPSCPFQTAGCDYTVTEADADSDSVDALVEKLGNKLKEVQLARIVPSLSSRTLMLYGPLSG